MEDFHLKSYNFAKQQATGNGSQHGKHYLTLKRDTAYRSAHKQQSQPKYLPHVTE